VQRGRRAPGAKGFHAQDHRPSEAWEESRPSSFTADGEGRVNHAGSPSEELKNRYRDHPASCEFKSVFSQPVILHTLCPPAMLAPGSPRSPVHSFVTGHTKWRDIHIGDPSNLSKWSLLSNFLHGSFNGPKRKNINAQSTVTPNTLFTAACGSPEGPERQRDDECRRRVGNCVEPDLTRAPATSHASPNLSPLSPLRCSPCTVVRPSLCVPPSRAFGAAERRQAAPSRRCHERTHIPRSLARVLCAPHPAFIDALELADCIHTGGSSIHRRRPPSSIHRHPPSIAPDARLLSSGRWLACTGQTF
jgi:hypothetical protein